MATSDWNPDDAQNQLGDGEAGLDPRLAARIDELPRELEPGRDLWPAIAARLPGRTPAPAAPLPRQSARFAGRGWWRQAAAALVWAGLGAAITWAALGERPATPGGTGGGSPGAMPASYGEAGAGAADYRLVEADYLRAKEALWISVYARREQFSPATLEAVERNLAIIDRAIFDLRQALAEDPGNHRLEGELYRNHRRGLDLLRRLAATA